MKAVMYIIGILSVVTCACTQAADIPYPPAEISAQAVKADHAAALEGITPVNPAQQLPEGLDTIDSDDGGNWLLKQVWWRDAEESFEKIISLIDRVCGESSDYLKAFNKAEESFAEQLKSVRAEWSQVEQGYAQYIETISEEKVIRGGDLSFVERELIEKLNENKQELDQFKQDITAINDLTEQLQRAMMQVDQQVTRCQGYEKKAWHDFKEIARTLSDERAQELYYQVDGYLKTVNSIVNYLKGDLKMFFMQTLQAREERIQQVVAGIESLKNKGIDLTKDLEELKAEDERLRQAQEEARAQAEQKKKAQSSGWWHWIISFFA